MSRYRRHSADVTADRLLIAVERWDDRLDASDVTAFSNARSALLRIAEEDGSAQIERARNAVPLNPGDPIPPERTGGMTGFVVGECGHRLAGSEWAAGFRNCERCGK